MIPSIKFCGAAGTVTGSCYWLRTEGGQILIDCGMFQGPKSLKELNYEPFPFDPKDISAVLLTHAHIDHSGLIPKLISGGFRGNVYMTEPTKDLLSYMLPDSGYIQEIEVEQLNRRNAERGRASVNPIYTREDAIKAQRRFRTTDYQTWIDLTPTIRARYWNAGHILGSASIEMEIETADPKKTVLRLLFSGDIGPEHKLFHPDPDAPSDIDYLICESTYGGRIRDKLSVEERRTVLAKEVRGAIDNGGVLLIPSFAVERTQELLADLSWLMNTLEVRRIPVFLDSPLAIKATSVFAQHSDDLEDLSSGSVSFNHPNFHFTETVEQSKSIGRYNGGIIILAGSGMCEAGRIRHHLKNYLWRDNTTVLLVGYQAPGTLGHLLASGKKAVRIWGQEIQVRAHIRQTDIYSGHADGQELVSWIKERSPIHAGIFLTHGEEQSLEGLKADLAEAQVPENLIHCPKLDDEIYLEGAAPTYRKNEISRRLQPEWVGKLDWHNDFAQLSIDLRELLENAADEKSRKAIVRRVRRAIDDSS